MATALPIDRPWYRQLLVIAAAMGLVIGLPLNMDDTESPMSARARKFAERLGRVTNTPVELVDERLSSREAADRSSRPRRDAGSHAAAAAVIAETWLAEQD